MLSFLQSMVSTSMDQPPSLDPPRRSWSRVQAKDIHSFFSCSLSPSADHPTAWNIGCGRNIKPSLEPSGYVPLIRKWLEDCEQNHPQCQWSEPKSLPTRVIDVGTSNETMKLYISREREEARYVALSHCWGCRFVDVTCMSNFVNRLSRIEITKAAKNYHDAIELTRALGFRFIW